VCVCPARDIADAARLSLRPGVLVATFGDMLRVPADPSLEEARGRGGSVRAVLSAADAVELARAAPAVEVVFFAVGFETTACTTAAALLADPPRNFSVLCAHRLIPPALRALLAMPEIAIDGFLLPGHVLTVAGLADYEEVVGTSRRPAVVAGFEPSDILRALRELVGMSRAEAPRLVNAYPRAVRPEGNPRALEAMRRVFRVVDAGWRGLGEIPASGYDVREEFAGFDARRRFAPDLAESGAPGPGSDGDPPGCRCGEVMMGLCDPVECPHFGVECTPERPRGACMVSLEGTCRTRYELGEG
jgi:hydrogenase expression/formation protein HypD